MTRLAGRSSTPRRFWQSWAPPAHRWRTPSPKAGVLQLSRDLGVHLGRSGVRVNALTLGPIETPQLRALFAGIGDDEITRRFVHYPMGRFGTPDELAGTVAYLASEDSGFITGAAFPVDGGITSVFTVPEQRDPSVRGGSRAGHVSRWRR
jgi:NAD(P)-dependent dehydrogenase (short-subunit alcohol dehydrogenase family)